jgi:hypothetical protein
MSPAGASPKITRHAALAGRPEPLPFVRREARDDGGCKVTVMLRRRGWKRWFVGEAVERTFGLDRLGREVYEACDGKSTVKAIVQRFAKSHKISFSEAEISVTMYLKTLVAKSLIAMAVARREK